MPDEAEPDQSRGVCEEFSRSGSRVPARRGDRGATRLFTCGQIIMPNYEVTLEVDPDRVGEMEGYMRTEHIPEILRTGCFSRITFERSDSGRFRTRYEPASQEALDAYFRDHAERLRQDFRRRFPPGRRAVTRSLDGGRALGWGPGKRSLSRSVEQKTKPIWLLDQPEETAGHRPGCRARPGPSRGSNRPRPWNARCVGRTRRAPWASRSRTLHEPRVPALGRSASRRA